jgi:hypothetical protein
VKPRVDVDQVLAAYRELRRWVAHERRRLERTGKRPTQRYLRRTRLLEDMDPRNFSELLRELRAITKDPHA